VLPAEHFLDLSRLHFLIERIERLAKFCVHRLPGLGPFDQDGKVVALLLDRLDELTILLEPAAALEDFLCLGLVFPEIGGGSARLEAGQFLIGFGTLKDSSADRQLAC
jgi:hypothetical protein